MATTRPLSGTADCATKYPIMLIHGIGFRDRKFLNYWGRIPAALERHGATLFYGGQDSWGNIEYNAGILRETLDDFVAKTHCQKVNIIAHSKGGLEARYLISTLGMADKVASLTTIATLHHGSRTIDWLCAAPAWLHKLVALFVNAYFTLLGDKESDFYTTSRQLTTAHMDAFNKRNPDAPSVYYQSYAGVMRQPSGDLFLCVPSLVVWLTEGENDGLVTPTSAVWTNFKGVVRGPGRRGVSHADIVDARRMNLSRRPSGDRVSDIREFYVGIVRDLKRMGM